MWKYKYIIDLLISAVVAFVVTGILLVLTSNVRIEPKLTNEQKNRVPYANCYIVTGNLQKCIEDAKKG